MCRKRSGGVPGYENVLNGVVGLVLGLDLPIKASVLCRIGGLLAEMRGTCCWCCDWFCCGNSRDGVNAGLCGLDLSYDICGSGGRFVYPSSMSSNFRFCASVVSVGDDSLAFALAAVPFAPLFLAWRRPAAFCRRSSMTLLPKIDSKRVCTILATSQTLDTSRSAFMHVVSRACVAETID